MGFRVCPECLNYECGTERYCKRCGNSLVDWELKCECGTNLIPNFEYSLFLTKRRPKPLHKYCPSCGVSIVDRFKMYAGAIQLLKK